MYTPYCSTRATGNIWADFKMWGKSLRRNVCLKMFQIEVPSISHCPVLLTPLHRESILFPPLFFNSLFFWFPFLSLTPWLFSLLSYLKFKKGFLFSWKWNLGILIELSTCSLRAGKAVARQRIRCSDLSLQIHSHSNHYSSQEEGQRDVLFWRSLWLITTLTKFVGKHPTPQ